MDLEVTAFFDQVILVPNIDHHVPYGVFQRVLRAVGILVGQAYR